MRKSIFLMFTIVQVIHLNGQTCSPDSLIRRSIKAFDTDNNISWELQNHQVYINPDCWQNDKLVIHLVGSFDNPANTTYFPMLAANNGFKVINLKYPNGVAAVSSCANSDDADCFQAYRQEIIHGMDSSSLVDVDADNCIVNRIEKLLAFLQASFPAEQWGDFLESPGEINWSNIMVSGHSQGGGHAAFIAKQYEVDRVLMFASPNDYSAFFSTPANWLSTPSATASSSYYAFGNLFDNVVDFSKQFENWNTLNLLVQTDSTNVDNEVCDYNNSNVVYTTYETSMETGNHSTVIVDSFTPLSAEVPIFTPVWEYMLGLCEVSTSISASNDPSRRIKLFPNPASSKVFIESELRITRIEIFSPTGVLLKTIEPRQKEVELNVEPFTGVLFLNITLQGATTQLRKVIIVD